MRRVENALADPADEAAAALLPRWREMPPIASSRSDCAAAALEAGAGAAAGKARLPPLLVCCGGHGITPPQSRIGTLATAEMLELTAACGNPAAARSAWPRWLRLPDMRQCRAGCAAVALPRTGEIVVLGGHDGREALASVEAIDPRAASPAWRALPPMPTARAWLCAAVLRDGRIVAIGGKTGHGPALDPVGDEGGAPTATYYRSVDVFDPAQGRWLEQGEPGSLPPMKRARAEGCVGVLEWHDDGLWE